MTKGASKNSVDEPISPEDYALVKPLLDEILELERERFGGREGRPEELAELAVEVCRKYAERRLKELRR